MGEGRGRAKNHAEWVAEQGWEVREEGPREVTRGMSKSEVTDREEPSPNDGSSPLWAW